jgi:S1-C subfamily serine protease
MTSQYPSSYPNPPPYRPPRSGSFLGTLFLLIVAAVIGYWLARWWERGTPIATPRPVAARGDLAEDEKATIQIFKQTNPSVVFITTLTERYDYRTLNVFEVPQGTGSGFIWDDGGDIVTNFHVVRGASAARVTLQDHSAYLAQLVGVAPENDLAVLRISVPKTKLQPIMVGKSSDLQVGQRVFAIGDPFGLDQTLTSGIVSAIGRTIQSVAGTPIEDVIQTDAAINPGNSGGPLLDSAGRLIGVNTAIYSPSGAYAGIGFAIPVDSVNRVVPELIAHGKITRPRLGVEMSDAIGRDVTQRMGVQGVLVMGVQPGSPAANAGLRGTQRLENGRVVPGDIIQQIDGQTVTSADELYKQIQKHKPGDTVRLTVWRQGKTVDVEVHLGQPGDGNENENQNAE